MGRGRGERERDGGERRKHTIREMKASGKGRERVKG